MILTSRRTSGNPVYAIVRTPCQLTKNSATSNVHAEVVATMDANPPEVNVTASSIVCNVLSKIVKWELTSRMSQLPARKQEIVKP